MDEDKAKSAKERLEAAKRAAEEADVVDAAKTKEDDEAHDEAKQTPPTDDADETTEPVAETAAEETPADEKEAPEEDQPPEDGESPQEDVTADESAAAAEEVYEDELREDATLRDEELAEDDHHEEAHHEGRPLSAMILTWLAVLVVGGAVALWAGPRVAPHLPGWAAPVAAFLTPGRNQADARIDALTAQVETLSARVEEVADTAGDEALAKIGAAENLRVAANNALLEKIEAVAAEPRADVARMDDLAKRLAKTEAQIAGLRKEVESLAGVTGENAAPSAETLKRVAAFGAAVEGLRAEVAEALAQTAKVEEKADGALVEKLTARVAALEAKTAAQTDAAAVRRGADIDVALAEIRAALGTGRAFGAALDEVAAASETPPPDALSAAASGAPALDGLLRRFPRAAQDGYAAALEAQAGEGFASRTMAKLQGRYGGRPSVETKGDDAGAVLSRIEARLKDGAADKALAEAQSLPAPARDAMAGWLADLETLVAAEAAFAAYSAAVGQ
jgi:hypothetical protein